MLLHDQDAELGFGGYGINVPRMGSIRGRVVEALREVPGLAGRENRWLRAAAMPPATRDDLLLVHDAAYVDELLSDDPSRIMREVYELDTPGRFTPETADQPLRDLAARAAQRAGGSMAAARLALENGFCFFLSGGMHHAGRAKGRGFCPVNDVVLAVRALRREGAINRAWIIDTDAHKGDGTAELCIDAPLTRTLSIHMAHGWPLDQPPLDERGRLKPAFIPSTIDIPIAEGAEDTYLPALENGLDLLATLSEREPPELAMVVGGADPWEHDRLESASLLKLTLEQLHTRDTMVHDFLATRRIPQCWLMAGGYGPDTWRVHAGFLESVLPGWIKESRREG
ncbi:histone deacetylase family protein [Desulfohalovibrio reitneri]|uniref:histone deacetylase family protein n=1 Tax=Desulfohalovibrio reitneri TaxID=1307759 RepID=UPI0004A6E7C3|nr:histone deacetylase [Desulfohalovibrio reitneri]